MPFLSWWSIALAGAVCCLASLVGYLAGRRRSPAPLPDEWRIDARPALNADERHALRLLREALPHNVVLAKLPLVRLCQPRETQQMRYWFELIGPVYVSFAVCSANGRVLAVVDLDTGRPTSARALRIKQGVLDACRIRYVRCRADNFPAASDLALLLRPQGPTARVAPMAPSAATPTPTFQNARGHLSNTVKTRRAQRSERWPNSGFPQDSFFAPASRLDAAAANSDFAASTTDAATEGHSARR